MTADGSLDDKIVMPESVALGPVSPLPAALVPIVINDEDELAAEDSDSAPSGGLGLGGLSYMATAKPVTVDDLARAPGHDVGLGTERKDEKNEEQKEDSEKERQRRARLRRGGDDAKRNGSESSIQEKVNEEADIDNPSSDDEEPDLNAEDDDDELLHERALRDVIPADWEAAADRPALDRKMVGKKVALRWNVTGWAVGIVQKHHSKPKGDALCNYVVRWQEGGMLQDMRLQEELYSVSDDGKPGSWCMLRQQRGVGAGGGEGGGE